MYMRGRPLAGMLSGIVNRQSAQNQSPDFERCLNASTSGRVDRLLDCQNKHNEAGDSHALLPEDNLIFYSQLLDIWKGLMTFLKTPEWENITSRLQSEERISRIVEHIPTDVKSMLASRRRHTVA